MHLTQLFDERRIAVAASVRRGRWPVCRVWEVLVLLGPGLAFWGGGFGAEVRDTFEFLNLHIMATITVAGVSRLSFKFYR